jgi:hypothetical protein
MNWKEIKIEYKDYITSVCNKNSPNETITFWNGCFIMKYCTKKLIGETLLKVKTPTTLIDYTGKKVGQVWGLKSKLK